MAANSEMSEWIKFFTAAGIPPGPAAKYSVVFLDNRIQKSMLMDLTKEYLKEMGISIMGDIIAILKYAKTAHIKYENEKPAITALQANPEAKVEVKRQSTPGNRMLEHYMRKEGILEGASTKVTVSPSMAVRLGAVPVGGTGTKKNEAVGLVETAEIVPVKRPRMVNPEEEGGYIINMPKGTTPKTQKILEKRKSPQMTTETTPSSDKKSSVFSRLGSGGNTPVTTASSNKTEHSPSQSTGDSSIFSRLGGKRERLGSEGSEGSVVEYQGVLKSSEMLTKTPRTSAATMSLPTSMMDSKMASTTPKQSLQKRLGKPVTPSSIQSPSKNLQIRLGKASTATAEKSKLVNTKGLHSEGAEGAIMVKKTTFLSPATKQKVTVTIGGAKKTGLAQNQNVMDRPGVQKPEVSTTTTSHMDQVGMKSKLQDRLGMEMSKPILKAVSQETLKGKGTVKSPTSLQLNKGGVAVKGSMQARLGAPVHPATTPTSPKPAGIKQRVTVTLGAKPSSMQDRLGTPPKAMKGIVAGFQSTTGSSVLKRVATPVISSEPAKQSRIKERLGLMKAEATSTTPTVTVTLDGGLLKQKMASDAAAKMQSDVFSRLGS